MLLYADHEPEDPKADLAGGSWRRIAAAEVPAVERSLWKALGGGPDLWRADCEIGTAAALWSHGFVFAEAQASQFDALRDHLRGGGALPGPVACLALCGRGFHGHRDRPWAALPGNVHLSLAVEPKREVSELVPALSMWPAVAVVEALRVCCGPTLAPGIKWVNDILIDGDKVAGVLCTTHSKRLSIDSVVLGIGVNLRAAPQLTPTPFVPGTTCLTRHLTAAPSLRELLWALLESTAARYLELLQHGGLALLEAYRRHAVVVGRQVRIYPESDGERGLDQTWPAPLHRGEVEAIEADLSLHLRGQSQRAQRGRLVFEEVCQRFGLL